MKIPVKIHRPKGDTDEYFVVGGDVVVLESRHDPRQLWLEFMGPVLFRAEQNETFVQTGKLSNKRLKKNKITPDHIYLRPYEPIRGVEQHILPFEKWQTPSRSLSRSLADAEFPAFDRDEEGNIYRLRYVGMPVVNLRAHEPMRDWVRANCVGRVLLDLITVFEKHDDAILAMMTGNFSKYEP